MKLNFRFITQQKRFGRYKTNPSREEIKISLCFQGIHGRREKTHGEISQVIQIPSTITEQYLFSFVVIKIYIDYWSAVRKHRITQQFHCVFTIGRRLDKRVVENRLITCLRQNNILLPVLGNAQMKFSVFLFLFFFFILLSQTYSRWWWNTD